MPSDSYIRPKSLSSLDTVYCADSVEFSPHSESADILLCGTYQLLQSASNNEQVVTETSSIGSKRVGRCYVYRTDLDNGALSELQRLDMPAILDMKWSYLSYDNGPQAAIADSEGRISTYRWSHAENQLLPLQTAQVAESTVLCLSLDWSGRQIRGSSESLVVSLSSGHISVLSHLNSGELDTICTWKAHDYEPWIAAWDYWSPNIAYSGGDDCRLKGWDIRLDGSGPIFDNKRFEAGVTTIQSHPNAQYLLAVGSYDSIVRIFDTRKPLVPIQQVDVGGGVWRVKWHPSPTRKSDLLTACMHDGFKVIDLGTNGAETPGITHSFDEHASLAYGVDWSHRDISGTLVASCSFYDHVLHTWKA